LFIKDKKEKILFFAVGTYIVHLKVKQKRSIAKNNRNNTSCTPNVESIAVCGINIVKKKGMCRIKLTSTNDGYTINGRQDKTI
jgi:hypothetical protein